MLMRWNIAYQARRFGCLYAELREQSLSLLLLQI